MQSGDSGPDLRSEPQDTNDAPTRIWNRQMPRHRALPSGRARQEDVGAANRIRGFLGPRG